MIFKLNHTLETGHIEHPGHTVNSLKKALNYAVKVENAGVRRKMKKKTNNKLIPRYVTKTITKK